MEELIKNIKEFIDSGNENLAKKRYNAAASDFFKSIVISCDYLIYEEIKTLPKNHNERFSLLKKYFEDIYNKVSELFETYTKSYNLRLLESDAKKIGEYAHEIHNVVRDKK